MSNLKWRKIIFVVLLCGMMISLVTPISALAGISVADETSQPSDRSESDENSVKGPFAPAYNDDLPPGTSFESFKGEAVREQPGTLPLPKSENLTLASEGWVDPALQSWNSHNAMPAPIQNWEGIPSTGVQPPDTDGQIGPNHYVQVVNSGTSGTWVRVWDKVGTQLYDFGMDSLWPSGDPCRDNAYGDPVVLYDQMADRWVLTQFIYPSYSGNWYECIAVSIGPVPSNVPGDWHVYSFPTDPVNFPDYPKFGVWPDGYYMMAHQFAGASSWAGTGVFVFERDAMLLGAPATFQYVDLYPVNPDFGGMLPANLMGSTLPPVGSPNYFVEVDVDWDGSDDILTIFEAQTTWPSGFSFTVVDELVVDPYVSPVCGNYRGQCIDQPNTTTQLESIADRLMMHAWYRNMGTYEVIVTNHTVNVGSNIAGIRWYEIRKDMGGNNWYIYQQGTFSPDSDHRWMGSIAMDHVGNIALGYSVSSSSTYPTIRYAGRLAGDPLNTLPQTEATIVNGLGYHSGTRWGDYSAMSVDTVDDCTFWYTQEYVASIGSGSWNTRVASFKFPNCSTGPTGAIEGLVTESGSSTPVPGASIVGISSVLTKTFGTTTNSNGEYLTKAPTEIYTVTASAFGYQTVETSDVSIVDGVTTTLNIELDPAAIYTVEGIVSDAATGWPLYAKIDIDEYPGDPIWTDPETGYYAISLPEGAVYTFNVEAWVPGYLMEDVNVGPFMSDITVDIDLDVDIATCNAPGYYQESTICYAPADGGLVVGNVYDSNTMSALNGAEVENEGGFNTTTVETLVDPNVDDGFYTLYSLSGSQVFTATMSGNYGPAVTAVTVVDKDTIRQNFEVPAGWLDNNPDRLHVALDMGISTTLPLTISNLGSLSADFEMVEANGGYTGLALSRKPLKQEGKNKSYMVSPYTLRLESPLALGDMFFDIDAGIITGDTQVLGVEYVDGYYWVTGANTGLEPNKLYKLDIGGNLVATYDQAPSTSGWGWVDLAYDGTYLYAADQTVIRQLDPASGATTGVSFPCPAAGCLALAYDPVTEHFWTAYFDSDIYELDNTGTIINNFANNLSIMGMAWDVWSPGGPYLWGWSQDGTPGLLASQIDPGTGMPTGIAFQGIDVGGSDIAGGAGLINGDHPNYGGMVIFVGLQQADSDMIVGYDLETVAGLDIPWLSEDPISGTVSVSSDVIVDVTFNAAVSEIGQPGDYTAELRVLNDTPYGSLNLPVTMTVNVPANFGRLDGIVTSLGYCDAIPAPLADAEVLITGSSGMTYTLATDGGGYYSWWLDEADSPYVIDVMALGHEAGNASGLSVTGGVTTTQDFDLRWLEPCVSTTPSSLSTVLDIGDVVTVALNLDNDGAVSTTFQIKEADGGFILAAPLAGEDILVVSEDGDADIVVEAALTNLGYSFLEVTSSTFTGMTVPELLEYQAVIYVGVTSAGAEQTQAMAYMDAGGSFMAIDNDLGYWENSTVFYQDYLQSTYGSDSGSSGVVVGMDIMAGISTDISTDPYPDDFTANPEGVGIFLAPSGNLAGIKVDRMGYKAIYLAWEYEYTGATEQTPIMDAALGFLAAGDIAWLSEDPIIGSIDADGMQLVEVTFNAGAIGQPGDYFGLLNVKTSDPMNATVPVPVTMTVNMPAGYGKLDGSVISMGYCDANPAPLVDAEVILTGSSGVSYTLMTDVGGYYSWWLDETDNPYTINVMGAEHESGYASNIIVTSGVTTTTDFDLRWLAPCVSISPNSLSVTLDAGDSFTLPMNLHNDGAMSTSFEIKDRDQGFVPAAPLIGEDILVVSEDGDAATAVEAALTNLGYSFLEVTSSAFTGMTVPDLLEYQAVIYVGITSSGAEQDQAMAYMDAGGSFMVMDNDLGYFAGGSSFYDDYLQSTYVSDSGSDGVVVGMDIMAGISTDISADPFPDDFTANPEGVGIFEALSGNLAGIRVDRMGYKSIYLAWDYDHTGAAEQTPIMKSALGFLIAGDVTWLSQDPITGTVSADSMLLIDVIFDSSVPEVSEPGDYMAFINVKSNDPIYPTVSIPVTMTISVPPDYGRIDGTVTGLGYCDADPGSLADAEVVISGTTRTITRTSDTMGYYSYQMATSEAPLTIYVSADGHMNGMASGVPLIVGQTTTEDFGLRSLEPCVSVDPVNLDVTLVEGYSKTLLLDLINAGSVETFFVFSEKEGGYTASALDVPNQSAVPGTAHPEYSETGKSSGVTVVAEASGGEAPEDIGTSWETMAQLPSARVFAAVVADINGYIYVAGGTSDGAASTPTDTLYRYNTGDNTWMTMTSLPAVVDSIDGFVIGNKLYIPGYATAADTFVYDIDTDTWSTIPANNGYTARSQYQVVAIGTDLYVLGGIVNALSASTNEVWVLNTSTGIWSAGVPMLNSRTSFSAGAIDGEIYVAGGVAFPGFAPDMTSEKFDGSNWSYLANLPDGGGTYTRWSYNADAVGENGLWLAAGRRDASWAVLNHAGYYDPGTDTWTDSPTIPTLAQSRVYMEGDVATDGYFYVIGGRDSAGTTAYDNNERLYVGYAGGPPEDVPWLSTDPITGTVSADSMQIIDVSIDTMTYTVGTYTATLKVKTEDLMYGTFQIPVTMTVEAIDYGVELTPAADSQSGLPGEMVTYTLQITNTGNVTDTYVLSESGANWSVDISDSSLTLGSGESDAFTVMVSLPAEVGGGDSDMVTITATGSGAVAGSSELTTETTSMYGVELVAEGDHLSAAPGSVVTYTVWMTNTGNVTDGYDMAAGAHVWDVDMPVDMSPMGAGESHAMEVAVTIPSDASHGDSDTVMITVSSQGDPTVMAMISLTTEAVMSEYMIYLPLTMK